MWHTVLELMLLSIQMLSIQLSSTAAFNFVDCGILWNAALNTEYSLTYAALNTAFRCISSKMSFRTLESVIQKSNVKLLVGFGPYMHTYMGLFGRLHVCNWAGMAA